MSLQNRTQTLIQSLASQLAERKGRAADPTPRPAETPHPPIHPPIRREAPAPDPAETLRSVSDRLTDRAAGELRPMARSIYRVLHRVALMVAQARGYARGVTRVSFAAPAELLAAALGIEHRGSFYRAVNELLELGLIDRRGHYTTFGGRTITDTTVWVVRLYPGHGKAPRVAYDELKQSYRDLAADIEAGRTVWALRAGVLDTANKMRQSDKHRECEDYATVRVYEWTDTPGPTTPQSPMTVALGGRRDLESVLDVPFVSRKDRAAMVDSAARALMLATGSLGLGYYRWLLWSALRLWDRGDDVFGAIYTTAARVRGSLSDGDGIRSGGALFTHLLGPLLERLRSVPRYRVAPMPR